MREKANMLCKPVVFISQFYYIPGNSDLKFIVKPCLASESNLLFHLKLTFKGKMCILLREILHLALIIKLWLFI